MPHSQYGPHSTILPLLYIRWEISHYIQSKLVCFFFQLLELNKFWYKGKEKREQRSPFSFCINPSSYLTMAGGLSLDHPWAFAFGLLGNVISFMVYLSPLPTFYRIYKKKSTEGFQSLPYVVALFSSMLWIFYAFIKGADALLLVTINSFGCVIETIYIIIYLIYAKKKTRMHTFKMFMLLNVGLFSLIVLCTLLVSKASLRLKVLGWISVTFSVSVFAAPLSIIRQVIRTKSVEFMPFSLSFFLTLSAVVWFSFGLFSKDIYIALPNILGFLFGAVQMVLYIIYKDTKVPESLAEEHKLPENMIEIAKLGPIESADVDIVTKPQVVYNEISAV